MFYLLREIYFDDNFNKKIQVPITNSVIYLTFGFSVNKEIEEAIPNSITLTFDCRFNQEIRVRICLTNN